MNLTVVVCDDEPIQVDTVVSYIKSFDINENIEIITASNGEELMKKIENKKIDIAFLDIEMESMNGIELGRKIRENYKDCIIVFITGFKGHAIEAFDLNAFSYILKPITETRFKKCMEDITLRLEEKIAFKEKNSVFTVNNKDKAVKIKYQDIFYFEKLLNKIRIYTYNGEYEYYGTLKKLKKELDIERSFIQCHQGYIVNISKIAELKDGNIYMRDIEELIPVSRRYKTQVRKKLEENLFS